LKLKVIAEGVETEEQMNYLGTHHCDIIQGYYYSRPMSATACEQWLLQGKRLTRSFGPRPTC
jgi:EAL domain-containing protein (putative c-di-GMP-specific phosphodiesterase class I)